MSPLSLQTCVPSQHATSFAEWWRKSVKRVQKDKRKGFNSLVVTGAWLLWKCRNSCVCEGANPCLAELLRNFRDEQHLWSMAGALP
ncbi:hypothetical protein PR202_gb29519 [Eleusine coracana subsp. coracana]|uniref:Uncharacterized protein n=1 Tax=Eleusine coracana subsp. coracana TaxID=191504 RepID=A0AAV5G0D2_ELECO|nr:hypothetical protein PR202_gb29519 [Eleusine coracana subsp. coracana]